MAVKHVKTGDLVVVLAGKDKGRTGKVMSILNKKDRVIVEKVNMIKKHQKPEGESRVGGIVEKEAPIHASNVALYSKEKSKGVRTGYTVERGTEGKVTSKVRVVRGTAGGEEI
jgi:large subunit ribosomal protein L24